MSRRDPLAATYDLPWDAATRDVAMDRIAVYGDRDWEPVGYRCRYNLTQELYPLGHIGFGWSRESNHGWVLAVNILDRWIDDDPRVCEGPAGVMLACHPACLVLAEPFRRAFLAPLSWWGGVIPGGQIGEWVRAQRGGLDLLDQDLAQTLPGWADRLDDLHE